MENQWRAFMYITAGRQNPVDEFIMSLRPRARTKVYSVIELLKIYGPQMHLHHAKKLKGTVLWELRILGSDSVRIFYAQIPNRRFVLLHGFKKKSYQTPRRELQLATRRLEDYLTRI